MHVLSKYAAESSNLEELESLREIGSWPAIPTSLFSRFHTCPWRRNISSYAESYGVCVCVCVCVCVKSVGGDHLHLWARAYIFCIVILVHLEWAM